MHDAPLNLGLGEGCLDRFVAPRGPFAAAGAANWSLVDGPHYADDDHVSEAAHARFRARLKSALYGRAGCD
jgi:hypothetical protein